ncbi:TPPC1 protein, partial [Sterrhoptilus dennistouni]|nr:TPPC1 protein [Sterrhoptilus dennistouni]
PQDWEGRGIFGNSRNSRYFSGSLSCPRRDGFVSFHTSKYRLHYLETPSGLRLVLNTDLGVPSAREALQHIYSNLFVELVVKNPLCPPRAPVQSLLFRQRLDAFVRSLPYFGPRNP